MRINSLLLSSAALMASATVGFAADLPSKKAAPVEYVRVCSQFGAGFFYIPGSDTCLKVGGRVRADYLYSEPLTRGANTTTTRARGYLTLDSYTASDWGPVRATTRVFVTRDSGRNGNTGNYSGSTLNTNGGTDANVTLDWAYIQFAGITAGRIAVSFFEFAPFGGVSLLGGGSNGRGSDYGPINTLAYTYKAGAFSATLAIEDGTERRVGLNAYNTSGTLGGYTNDTALGYGGHVMPDLVARLEYTDSWGIAALTGAIHQTRSAINSLTAANRNYNDTEYGYAIQGGVKINLPMLAAGDALFLQAAYADGASSYTGFGGLGGANISTSAYNGGGAADVEWVNGSAKTVKTWSVTGGVEHYWVPTVSTALFAAVGGYNGALKNDYTALNIGANVKWTPVKGLLFAAEAVYVKALDYPNVQINNTTAYLPNGSFNAAGTQKDAWSGRLRVQRDF